MTGNRGSKMLICEEYDPTSSAGDAASFREPIGAPWLQPGRGGGTGVFLPQEKPEPRWKPDARKFPTGTMYG